jgi:hypothetical protein
MTDKLISMLTAGRRSLVGCFTWKKGWHNSKPNWC